MLWFGGLTNTIVGGSPYNMRSDYLSPDIRGGMLEAYGFVLNISKCW